MPDLPANLPPDLPPYLPLTSDYGFKVAFGNQKNTLFLRRALQALIQSETAIREVRFLPTAFEGLTVERRGGVLDLSCVDERGRHFIVEMQVAHAPEFLQRLKFYALHQLEALVQRGPFTWADLPPIYCVGLLSRAILPSPDYHTVANLRKASGELVDAQLTFVLVELEKFSRPAAALHTDLDKLLYTMQNSEQATREQTSEPAFWQEDWLRVALDELDTRKMTRAQYNEYLYLQMQRMDERTAEQARQRNEAARREAEEQRLVAEQQRREAEQQAAAAEQQRVVAEQQRVVAEQQRVVAEQQVAVVEQERVAAEQRLKTTVLNLLRSGRFTPEEVAELSGSPLAQVLSWNQEK